MMGIRMILIVTLAAFLLNACGSMGKVGELFQPSPAEQKLSGGVKSYEEGNYKSSQEDIQKALEMGLSKKSD